MNPAPPNINYTAIVPRVLMRKVTQNSYHQRMSTVSFSGEVSRAFVASLVDHCPEELYSRRQKIGTRPSSNPKPNNQGAPAETILHPCSNFWESTVGVWWLIAASLILVLGLVVVLRLGSRLCDSGVQGARRGVLGSSGMRCSSVGPQDGRFGEAHQYHKLQ